MRITRASLVLLLALFAVPQGLCAQNSGRVHVVPLVGWSLPLNELGAVEPTGSAWYLSLGKPDPTLALGASVEVHWPSSPFGVRVTGVTTLQAGAGGFFDCYPGLACPAVLLDTDADVSALAATADLLFSPFRARPVRPFAVVGAGFRRYAFDWPAPPVLVEAGSHSETTAAVRLGLGMSFDVLGGSFRAEVGDLWSPVGDRIRPSGAVGQLSAPGRRDQHDLNVNLGWVLLRF